MKDYEALRRELPTDNEVAESLRQAQIAMNKSRGEVYNTKCEVEQISALDKFRAAIASPGNFNAFILNFDLHIVNYVLLRISLKWNFNNFSGISVVHFKEASNEVCEEISPFINMLCVRYPSIKFFKVCKLSGFVIAFNIIFNLSMRK